MIEIYFNGKIMEKINLKLWLIRRLSDSSPHVRSSAARALGAIGDKRALSFLSPLLNSPDNQVREAADYAIKKINNNAPVISVDNPAESHSNLSTY